MTESLASALVALFAIYAGIGWLFALAFVLFGAGRLDAPAQHASWPFRLLILPGSAALWPALAVLWWRARTKEKSP